jgi:hydroxymethylglutaryl-CoA lyase
MERISKTSWINMRRIAKIPSNKVRIVEVGLRDGLQNEKGFVPTNVKIELLKRLTNSGLKSIEVGSYVSPKWVPQMRDTDLICKYIKHQQLKNAYNRTRYSCNALPSLTFDNISYSVLTPNLTGVHNAITRGGINEVAIFAAATEEFSKQNINCTIDESIKRFEPVVNYALTNNIRVRGYISCVLGCPFEGTVDPMQVAKLTKQMLNMGCYEVSLGDTIGVGTVDTTTDLLECLIKKEKISPNVLAAHFHDTYGQALVNLNIALHYGIRVIDSSVSGLGGCPYAGPTASGNVATEDVVHMLHQLDLETGVNINKIFDAAKYIDDVLGRKTRSTVLRKYK